MRFELEFLGNTQSKAYMLSLTDYTWEFLNNALWDTVGYCV